MRSGRSQRFWWFSTIGGLAADEQQRSGHPEIDYEHLLLALIRAGGPVTDLLGRHGITLTTMREALQRAHAMRIGILGVTVPSAPPPATTVTRAPTGGPEWSPRALELVVETRDADDQPTAVLRGLLADPTGHLPDAVRLTGASTDTLLEEAAALPHTDLSESPDGGDGWLRASGFVPATADDVLELVSDPGRWLEWNSEEFERAEITGNRVVARPNSSPVDRLFGWITRRPVVYELGTAGGPGSGAAVHWTRTIRGLGRRENLTSFTVTVEPEGSGCRVSIGQYPVAFPRLLSARRDRTPNRLERFAVRAELQSGLAGIARAIRNRG